MVFQERAVRGNTASQIPKSKPLVKGGRELGATVHVMIQDVLDIASVRLGINPGTERDSSIFSCKRE